MLFMVIAPVLNVPAGTTTLPPPALEHASMALFMAFWFAAAFAFGLAPYLVMLKTLSDSFGSLMLFSICLYCVSHPSARASVGNSMHKSSKRRTFILFIAVFVVLSK